MDSTRAGNEFKSIYSTTRWRAGIRTAEAFLQSVCGGDEAMMAEVHAMLEEDSRAGPHYWIAVVCPTLVYRMRRRVASIPVSFRGIWSVPAQEDTGREGGDGVVWASSLIAKTSGNLGCGHFCRTRGCRRWFSPRTLRSWR